jgi:two-component system response regulator GlrR
MAHRLLLIEQGSPAAETSLGPLLASLRNLDYDAVTWDSFVPDSLNRSAANLIVAVAATPTAKMMSLFEWLCSHSIAAPTLAVLPEGADEELMHRVVEVADDFAFCPLRRTELERRVTRLLGPERSTVDSVRARLTEEMGLSQLVWSDPVFTRVVEQLPSIARSDAPVLIIGETGTGKELCARAIHFLGKRRNFPFIAVDCAAVPDHLFENEFFGHARGAFTDAHRDQRGLVAMAEGGTLFLDEVDALSPAAQVKLLRFLQERAFRPLGADRFERADVNVIAASNRDMESCVRDKQLRSDLYFRLNVLRICLPPLRERGGDVAVLARRFLEELHKPGDPARKSFSTSAMRALALYDWPGNVRELLNVVHRAKVACDGAHILPCHITLCHDRAAAEPPARFRAARAAAVEAFERRYVEDLLRKHRGNITRAAREAQKDRRAFGRLVKKYNITRQAL